jgi:hypothetical protein
MSPIASSAALLLALAVPTFAQFPAEPVGRKVLESRFGEGVTITYKEVQNTNPSSICKDAKFSTEQSL